MPRKSIGPWVVGIKRIDQPNVWSYVGQADTYEAALKIVNRPVRRHGFAWHTVKEKWGGEATLRIRETGYRDFPPEIFFRS